MRKQRRLTFAKAVVTSVVTLLALSPWLDAPVADATQGEAFPDSDGDFLPDILEFSTLSDPLRSDTDGDGIDDFMATVRYLRSNPRAGDPEFRDHEMRILLSSESRSDGSRAVWMHFLFRFADGQIPTFERFQPFIDHRTWRLPLSQIFGYGQVHLKMRQDAVEGLLVHAAVEIGSEDDLRFIQPYEYTLGVDASIDGKRMTRGVFVQAVDELPGDPGVLSTMVPMADNKVALQVLNIGESDNPFWSNERICVLTIETFASGSGGHTCQIVEASCEPLNAKVQCPPSCPQSSGGLVFFPNGFGTIAGGT